MIPPHFYSKDGLGDLFGRPQRVLTNLSEFNLLRSLKNPILPLIDLAQQLGNKLEIRSAPQLRAKLFLADQTVALHGSSNLTLGGGESNHELNMLVSGRTKKVKDHITSLDRWVNSLWENSGAVDAKMLGELEQRWQVKAQKMLGAFKELIPEYKLAGQQWDKIKKITQGKGLSEAKVLEILIHKDSDREGEEKDQPANAKRKLLFLEEQGIVRLEGCRVVPVRKFSKPKELIGILSDAIPCFQAVVDFFQGKEMVTYKDLDGYLNSAEKDPIRTVVLWLEDLGFVSRKKTRQGDEFRLIGYPVPQ